jgi:hypothetical protein
MQEITDWLTRLGLPEYAGAFAENGIDVSVLPHLTDQDLKDIGVLLGHRRKILAPSLNSPESRRQHPSLSLRWWRHDTSREVAPVTPRQEFRRSDLHEGVGEKKTDGLRLLIVIGACGTLTTAFRDRL